MVLTTSDGITNAGSPGIKTRTEALLVVVLKEIEHVGRYPLHSLPARGELGRRSVAALYATQGVVEIHLVVKVVEPAYGYEVAVQPHIIYLGDKGHMREMLLDVGDSPLPELQRYHVDHVAAESIDTLGRPVAQDVEHLEPGVGYRREMVATVAVVHSVIKFYGIVPVAMARESGKAVIARRLGRKLHVSA